MLLWETFPTRAVEHPRAARYFREIRVIHPFRIPRHSHLLWNAGVLGISAVLHRELSSLGQLVAGRRWSKIWSFHGPAGSRNNFPEIRVVAVRLNLRYSVRPRCRTQ